MREIVASVAGPRQWGDTRESWLSRAARKAGISHRQTKALFYGEITDPNHRSARLMLDAAQRKASDIAQQYETIARSLNASDPDFFGHDIAALISVARKLRGVDRPGDSGDEE